MHINEEEEIKKEFQLERVILFTDAVFAIILTIMVLDIKLPEELKNVDAVGFHHEIKLLVLRLIGYLVTFVLVSRFWMLHLNLFRYLKDYDRNLLILNLAFLFSVTLFPFAISNLFHETPGQQIKDWKQLSIQDSWSLQIYITIALLTTSIQSLISWYLLSNRQRLCINTEDLETTLQWKVTRVMLFLAPAFLVLLIILNCFPLPYYTPFIIVGLFGFSTGKLKQHYYPKGSYSGPVLWRLYNYAKNNRFKRPVYRNTLKKEQPDKEQD